jgi:hypothetical protein
MDYKDHSLQIGYIHTNLTALESSLRFFLLKATHLSAITTTDDRDCLNQSSPLPEHSILARQRADDLDADRRIPYTRAALRG